MSTLKVGEIKHESFTGTTQLKLDSAGRLLVGTTTQGTTGADELTVATTGSTGITIRSGTSNDGNLFFADGTSGNDTYRGFIQYEHSNNVFRFGTNSLEAMRIDSSGNIGIGTASPSEKLDVEGTIECLNELRSKTGNDLKLNAGSANRDIFLQVNDSTLMTVQGSTGRLGIGTVSPVSILHLHEAGASGSPVIQFSNGDTGTTSGDGFAIGVADDESPFIYNRENTALRFATNNTERMRITSDGKFYVGTANGAFGNNASQHAAIVNGTANEYTLSLRNTVDSSSGRCLLVAAGKSTGGRLVFFERADGGTLGSITIASASSVSYNTSSDYRLKENVTTITDGITRLKTLKPSRFNWKDDPDTTFDGFLAHEVTAVPEAITGTKDEVDENNEPVYQGIDQSKLVPLLVAAVQELTAKVEALEAK